MKVRLLGNMYVAIDIGGTTTRIGLSRDGWRFFAIEKFRTPKKFEDGLKKIRKHLESMRKDGGYNPLALRIRERAEPHPHPNPLPASRTRQGEGSEKWTPIRLAIAMPGSVDAHGRVHGLPNLPDWNPKKLARAFSHLQRLGLRTAGGRASRVAVYNDADAAGIGEARRGAGKGYRKVAYFTLSTGVGGALITAGRLDRQIFEPGHQLFVRGSRLCGCGRRGCFEAYASGKGFLKTYGVRPEHCRDKKIWASRAQIVAKGIINALGRWPPDVIVVGGGMSQVGSLLFTPLRAYFRAHCKTFSPPPILRAKLGDNAGLYGCLELMQSNRSH